MVNVTGVHHLALFICHLFIDGPFRTAHFLYKPSTFDFKLLDQLDAVCTEPIPMYLIDVTQSWKWPWNQYDTPDNVLQLNFLDDNKSKEDIVRLPENVAHYQVFGFDSHKTLDNKIFDSVLRILSYPSDSKVLVVRYNAENVTVYVDYGANETLNLNLVLVVKNETNYKKINLFDRTFGELERTQPVSIERLSLSKEVQNAINIHIKDNGEIFSMHYYHLHLNNSFINITTYALIGPFLRPYLKDQRCTLESSDYYKELTPKYQCTDIQNSIDRTISVHLSPYSTMKSPTFPHCGKLLYPYRSRELKCVFVYGSNFNRGFDFFRISDSVKLVAALILLFLVIAIFTLYMIRKRFELRGRDVGSCVLYCLIPFIGGGNLRMEHRFERRFFGILLFSAFFIVSVFGGDLVDSVLRVLNTKVRTFEDVTKFNPQIYLDPDLLTVGIDVDIMLSVKMDANISESIPLYIKTFLENGTSLLLITPSSNLDYLIAHIENSQRNYDIMEERLGEVLDRQLVLSDEYMSERMVAKIDKVTNSMAEHGFYQFYESISDFQTKWRNNKTFWFKETDANDDPDLQPIILKQFEKPIVIFLYLNGIAAIVFVLEVFIFKWLKWRNCRVQILPLVQRQPNLRTEINAVNRNAKRCRTAPSQMENSKQKYAKRRSKKRRSARF